MSEKTGLPGLPDIEARKSWDFLILTVSASTVLCELYDIPFQICRDKRIVGAVFYKHF